MRVTRSVQERYVSFVLVIGAFSADYRQSTATRKSIQHLSMGIWVCCRRREGLVVIKKNTAAEGVQVFINDLMTMNNTHVLAELMVMYASTTH